jgi:hypothetical protein
MPQPLAEKHQQWPDLPQRLALLVMHISSLVRTIFYFLGSFLLNDISGPMTILPLRRLFIERQIQPEMLSFVSTEEVVALFNMWVSSQ